MIHSIFPSFRLAAIAACVLLCAACGDNEWMPEEETINTDGGSGRELAEGERCNVTLSIDNLPSFEQTTTRSIPQGKKSVLQDYTNHELTDKSGKEAAWLSASVRTQYDETVRAATRAFDPNKQLFGKNSKFRMLVFVGKYTDAPADNVNMDVPIANMVCQVNAQGTSASFIEPATSLGLLKGNYVFVCFPADEKYNKWKVGESASKTDHNEITVNSDEDFVCLKTGTLSFDSENYKVNLSEFQRYGYQLTTNFAVNTELGHLIFPAEQVVLEIGDAAGTAASENGNHIINSEAIYNLANKTMATPTSYTITDTIKVLDKPEANIPQTFAPATSFVIANAEPTTAQKLTISYPQLTVKKPAKTEGNAPVAEDSIFTIAAGTYTTKKAINFKAGNSYTVTLAIGERIVGVEVKFKDANGNEKNVIFAFSQLCYKNGKYQVSKEQCDYGYVEANIPPNTNNNVLWDKGYYFMYGCVNPGVSNSSGNTNTDDTSAGNSYYSGTADLWTVNRDPCTRLGGKWQSPTRDIYYDLGGYGTNYYDGSSKTKTQSEYFPVDESGNRLVYDYSQTNHPNWGTYTPKDGRANKTPVSGMWFGLSATAKANTSSGTYNKRALFFPAAGIRRSGTTTMNSVGAYGDYWAGQQYNSSVGQDLNFNSGDVYLNYSSRSYGFTVRCVLPE